jgi:hypothetical protein
LSTYLPKSTSFVPARTDLAVKLLSDKRLPKIASICLAISCRKIASKRLVIRHSQITSNYLAILDRQIAIAYLAIKERKNAEPI